MRSPLIIDCDTGRDDALAIWLALALDYPLKVLVSSYGNVVRDSVSDNCLRVLSYAGRDDIDVLAGAFKPSQAHPFLEKTILPRQAVAGNGLCNLTLPESAKGVSPQALAQAITAIGKTGGKIDYVITGPATNLASIIDEVSPYIGRITMMGGKTGALWDAIPGADFNILCDPFAVKRLLHTSIPMRFVTMNTTWPIVMTLPEIETLEPVNKIASFSKDLMIAHAQHFAPEPVFRFHDPAVLALLDSNHFAKTKLAIDIDETSPDFGRLTEDASGDDAYIHDAGAMDSSVIRHIILSNLGFKSAV